MTNWGPPIGPIVHTVFSLLPFLDPKSGFTKSKRFFAAFFLTEGTHAEKGRESPSLLYYCNTTNTKDLVGAGVARRRRSSHGDYLAFGFFLLPLPSCISALPSFVPFFTSQRRYVVFRTEGGGCIGEKGTFRTILLLPGMAQGLVFEKRIFLASRFFPLPFKAQTALRR